MAVGDRQPIDDAGRGDAEADAAGRVGRIGHAIHVEIRNDCAVVNLDADRGCCQRHVGQSDVRDGRIEVDAIDVATDIDMLHSQPVAHIGARASDRDDRIARAGRIDDRVRRRIAAGPGACQDDLPVDRQVLRIAPG